MKRNFLVVLLLVLIGGGFMYLNSNTDFFKGQLTVEDETQTDDDVSINLPFEDNHFIDLYMQSRMEEYNDCNSNIEERSSVLKDGNGNSNKKCAEIRTDANNRTMALVNLFNLNYYDNFRAKKVDGNWVACEDNDDSDDCKNLKQLGYTKEFFNELFGLDPYEVSTNQVKFKTGKKK